MDYVSGVLAEYEGYGNQQRAGLMAEKPPAKSANLAKSVYRLGG